MKIALYCTCGAAATGSGKPRSLKKITDIFWQVHVGPGHAPCDAKTAHNTRRRQETVDERERRRGEVQ